MPPPRTVKHVWIEGYAAGNDTRARKSSNPPLSPPPTLLLLAFIKASSLTTPSARQIRHASGPTFTEGRVRARDPVRELDAAAAQLPAAAWEEVFLLRPGGDVEVLEVMETLDCGWERGCWSAGGGCWGVPSADDVCGEDELEAFQIRAGGEQFGEAFDVAWKDLLFQDEH